MNDFTLRELECFEAVAEELSFTRAAQRLHLAQPPLSRHIRNLEKRLDTRLFERSAKRVKLTREGQVFQRETRGILVQLRRAAEVTRRAASGKTERLDIAFVSSLYTPEITHSFRRFRLLHPEIELSLHDCLPADQLAAIQDGKIDGGFPGLKPERAIKGIVFRDWGRERLMAYVPPGSSLFMQRSIRMEALAQEGFVMVSSAAAPGYGRFIRDACQKAGFQPKVVQEADRAQAVAAMTVAGTGVAILPETMDVTTRNGIPIVPPLELPSVFAYRKDASPALEAFIEASN